MNKQKSYSISGLILGSALMGLAACGGGGGGGGGGVSYSGVTTAAQIDENSAADLTESALNGSEYSDNTVVAIVETE